jgi:hypothetical protein
MMKFKKTLITVSAAVALVVGCTFVLANNSSNGTNVIAQYSAHDDDYGVSDEMDDLVWGRSFCGRCGLS